MAGPTTTAAVLTLHQGRVPSAAESDPKPEVVKWCASAGRPKGMLGCGRGKLACISAAHHLCRRAVGVETFQSLPP
jgi:hypothetical protein